MSCGSDSGGGGVKAADVKRLKEFEAEHARLEKLLAEAEPDKRDAPSGVSVLFALMPERQNTALA